MITQSVCQDQDDWVLPLEYCEPNLELIGVGLPDHQRRRRQKTGTKTVETLVRRLQ